MKNYLKITPILAVYVSLIACGGGGSSSNTPSNNNTATTPVASSTASTSTSTSTSRQFMGGIYDSPGYGEMTEIIFDGSQYTVTDFSYTQDNCLVQAEGKLSIEEFNDAIEFKDNNTILELKGTVIFEPAQQGKRIDSLPEKCKSGLLPLKGSKDYTFDADRDFKFLWDKVNEYHVGIEASKTNWDEIYSRFKPRVSSIKNEKQLLELFKEMLTPLADPHTTLVQGSLKDGINDLLNRPSGVDFAGKTNLAYLIYLNVNI
ncbi:hypothetical protein [Agarilytica rhodophyticola]|uniref:hypothetical protein n=1 Tax=Agarilytica rhodophyticola TaxID=1737490 RepID=UPI000B344467|nr:hypothetical protein [Agarilytica rhodophyticola]